MRSRFSHQMHLLLVGRVATPKGDVAKRFLDRTQNQVIERASPRLLH
jgi:hypothetical protein